MLRKKVISIVILSICSSFLQVDGRQNDAFSCFTGALKHLRKLNGYGADYAQNKFFKETVLPVVRDLKMYQKLSMHPLSHAHLYGVPTYTEKELSMTITLIEKLEGVVNELMNFDVSTV